MPNAAPRNWARDPALEARALQTLEALGVGSCELPRLNSRDITHADVLRGRGSAALVAMEDFSPNYLSDKATFEDAFGDVELTPVNSFLFSHFGHGIVQQLPVPQFYWHQQRPMREWVESWSVFNDSGADTPELGFGDIGQREHLEITGNFRPPWLQALLASRIPPTVFPPTHHIPSSCRLITPDARHFVGSREPTTTHRFLIRGQSSSLAGCQWKRCHLPRSLGVVDCPIRRKQAMVSVSS